MEYKRDSYEKKIYLATMFIVLIGCIYLSVSGLTNTNSLEKLNDFFDFGRIPANIIYLIFGISALFLVLKRDVYLPFLGDAVYPTNPDELEPRIPEGANKQVVVKVPPNSPVVYWAAQSGETAPNPQEAYGDYSNSGVAISDKFGNALLKFRNPRDYKIPSGNVLKPHVHYRYGKYHGMMSRIETIDV